MSDGFGAPGQGPQGTPPAGAGSAQNQPGPVPPPSGGFGPPPASYGPVLPPAQPVAQPVPPVPQPGPVPPQPAPQPVQQPPAPQPVQQPPAPQPAAPQPVQQPPAQPAPQWQPQAQPTLPAQQFQPQPPQAQPVQQPRPPRAEPDWEALADRNEADGKRKRRTKVIGIAAAVVLVGGLAAGGVVLMNGKHDDPKKPVTAPTAPVSTPPSPAPATTQGGAGDDPSKPIWDVSTDPAPQDANALFSAAQVNINGATWNRTTVSLDQPCWDGNSTTGGLGKILGDQGCQKVLRATYVSGDSAVTVGVAVFDHKIQAETATKNYAGQLKGLSAPGAPAYCANPGCANTHNVIGRYAYFTVEGSVKGGNTADATATAAAGGFAEHVKGQLLQRAKAAGNAAPGAPAAPAATPTG
ncbi:hypothetical protein ACPC54_13600 [Kitasatospora sp. NPDC094028]